LGLRVKLVNLPGGELRPGRNAATRKLAAKGGNQEPVGKKKKKKSRNDGKTNDFLVGLSEARQGGRGRGGQYKLRGGEVERGRKTLGKGKTARTGNGARKILTGQGKTGNRQRKKTRGGEKEFYLPASWRMPAKSYQGGKKKKKRWRQGPGRRRGRFNHPFSR